MHMQMAHTCCHRLVEMFADSFACEAWPRREVAFINCCTPGVSDWVSCSGMEISYYIASSLLFVDAVGEIESIDGSDAIIIMLFVGDDIIIMLFVGFDIIGWIRI